MKFEYDKEVDGLYIWFTNEIEKLNYAGEIWPIELNNEIGFLFEEDGKLLGLEIMPASKYFKDEMLKKL
jgi:uncharacterized protein YuzE